MDLNCCIFKGRVVQWKDSIKVLNPDDEMKCVVRTSISQKYNGKKSQEGYYPDQTIPITLFGKNAINFAKMIKPGDQITVRAEFRTDTYTDKEGNTVKTYYFRVEQFDRLGVRADDSQSHNQTSNSVPMPNSFGVAPSSFGMPPTQFAKPTPVMQQPMAGFSLPPSTQPPQFNTTAFMPPGI